MADRDQRRIRRLASATRREASLARAAVRAYNRLMKAIEPLLASSSYDASVLDDRLPAWRDAVDEELVPEVTVAYTEALLEDARAGVTIDAQAYATKYLTTVHNRLVGVADYVFDQVAGTLSEGNQKGESIPELAARIDSLFTDKQRWKNRATVVARTEVVGANNAGHEAAAGATADHLEVPHALVAKEWLATHDTRTRPHHRDADGQQVMGLSSKFTVGTSKLLRPGDVAGPGEEVIQCRCSALYHFPGDLDYPDALTSGGSTMPSRPLHRQHAIVASGSPCDEHPCCCLGCDTFDCGLDACACCWSYNDADDLELVPEHPDAEKIEALAASLAGTDRVVTFDVSRMPPKLQAYWLGPEGVAKIGYGTPGQFKRCQAALAGKVPARMIDGSCSNLIHKATGEWPGGKPDAVAASGTLATFATAPDSTSPMIEPPPGKQLPTDVEPSEPEDGGNTGLWIGFLPAADEEVHGIGPEEKHCTAFYLGETSQFTDQDHTDLATLLQQWASTTPAEESAVTGTDRLGRDDTDKALVWPLDDALAGPREALAATPLLTRLLEVAADLQFPSYLPHVTVGYPDSQTDDVEDTAWPAIEDAAGDVKAISFDRVAMWWGDDKSAEWPLTGGPDTPTAPPAPAEGAESTPTEEDDAVTAAGTEQVVETDAATSTDLTWVGVLCPEGVVTGDKRKFAAGSMTWFSEPVVLKAMFADQPGHDGSVPVGLILGIERTPDGKLNAHGTWDVGPNAVEARRQNIAGLLRGVSVDLDSVEMHLEDDQGQVLEGDAMWDMDVEPTLVVDSGRIRAATLWCTPAYVEAYVLDSTISDEVPDLTLVGAKGESPLGLAASAVYAEVADDLPTTVHAAPASAFANPGLTEPTCLTVTDDGRIFGHLAVWGTCHIGIDGACVTPPESQTDYAYMCTGMYPTSDGEVLPVGQLTMGTGHADLALGWRPTVDHYDHTGTAAAYFNIGEDEVGIWFAGALAEDLPLPQRLALTRSGSVSGDWRQIGGNLELVAALAVNVPGFPIPRVRSRVASLAAAGGRIQPTALVASGVVRHVEAVAASGIDYKLLAREVVAHQTRQARLTASRGKVREARKLAALGRLRKG